MAAFQKYMDAEGQRVTRAQFERDLAGKAQDPAFLGEVRAMLARGLSMTLRPR